MLKVDIIYNKDCLEGMKELPDKCIDAVIADMPYGVLNRKNGSAGWDRQIPLDALWEQYRRITTLPGSESGRNWNAEAERKKGNREKVIRKIK